MRYVDTSFWVALQFRRDLHHDWARQLGERGRGSLLTPNPVLGKTWTFLRRRVGHPEACLVPRGGGRPPLAVTGHVDEDTEAKAWRWLARHHQRPYSLVHATGLTLMRRLRVREALAFAGDCGAAGFIESRG